MRIRHLPLGGKSKACRFEPQPQVKPVAATCSRCGTDDAVSPGVPGTLRAGPLAQARQAGARLSSGPGRATEPTSALGYPRAPGKPKQVTLTSEETGHLGEGRGPLRTSPNKGRSFPRPGPEPPPRAPGVELHAFPRSSGERGFRSFRAPEPAAGCAPPGLLLARCGVRPEARKAARGPARATRPRPQPRPGPRLPSRPLDVLRERSPLAGRGRPAGLGLTSAGGREGRGWGAGPASPAPSAPPPVCSAPLAPSRPGCPLGLFAPRGKALTERRPPPPPLPDPAPAAQTRRGAVAPGGCSGPASPGPPAAPPAPGREEGGGGPRLSRDAGGRARRRRPPVSTEAGDAGPPGGGRPASLRPTSPRGRRAGTFVFIPAFLSWSQESAWATGSGGPKQASPEGCPKFRCGTRPALRSPRGAVSECRPGVYPQKVLLIRQKLLLSLSNPRFLDGTLAERNPLAGL